MKTESSFWFSFFFSFLFFSFCMPAIHTGAAVLRIKLHLVYVLLFVVLWKQRVMHAIVEVWPYSQNFWSQHFLFLTPHSLISRVKVHFECKLDYHFTYLLACVSSTLVLLVYFTV
jgi:hypothetical protein